MPDPKQIKIYEGDLSVFHATFLFDIPERNFS
jgi:hypothetical protein